jgi:pSer/pThr/pTyr-binding forkhead associated (FHA) protein
MGHGRASHDFSPRELSALLEAERKGLPFLVIRDAAGDNSIVTLVPGTGRVILGRGEASDVRLHWDEEVSSVHAALEEVAGRWVAVDDGLSKNGTFLNGERLRARTRLEDGDRLELGGTVVRFRSPAEVAETRTRTRAGVVAPSIPEGQQRVLLALARPFKDGGDFATPATNQEIADELFLSVDAVKAHLRQLYGRFGIESLPQNRKRAALVDLAFRSGTISRLDL